MPASSSGSTSPRARSSPPGNCWSRLERTMRRRNPASRQRVERKTRPGGARGGRPPREARARLDAEVLRPALGRAPERLDAFRTASGIPVERVYTAGDVAGIEFEREIGVPGAYP